VSIQSAPIRRVRQLWSILCVVALSPAIGRAEVINGLDFLNIGIGSRAAAMGGAFVAVSDDASAAYWNPAGLSRVRSQVMFAHNAYIVDMKQEYLSLASHIGPWALAGSFNIFDVGSIERRDEAGNLVGKFRPFDLAVGFSTAYEVRDGLSLGATAKGIISDIDVQTATGILVDIGALWESGIEGLSLGLNVKNLGPSLTFISEPFDAPLAVRGGVAYQYSLSSANSRIVLSLDVERMRGGDVETSVGGEWYYGRYLAGRLGLRPNADTRDFTAGLGAHYRDFIIDYAFVPFSSDLGSAHRIGVTYLFHR